MSSNPQNSHGQNPTSHTNPSKVGGAEKNSTQSPLQKTTSSPQSSKKNSADLQTPQKNQTSVAVLDSLFEGGIPSSSNVLLYGEPMCGKKILLMQFIYEGLKSQIPGIFILTDFGISEWKIKMQSLRMDLDPFEKSGLLKVIDCYSRQFEPSLQNTDNIKFASSPSALSNISLLISETQAQILESHKNHRVALHSLSSLLEESSEKHFYKFMQLHVGKFRKNSASTLFTMEKGMHDSKDVAMVEHLMDAKVVFEDTTLRAKGLGANSKSKNYSIGNTGLEIN